MKLIDLLVQELPKRGGWPVTVGVIEMHDDGDIFFDGEHAPDSFKLPQCDDGWHRGLHSSYSNEVPREQYEAALSASQQPAWDGEGLPPVGTIVDIIDIDERLRYGQNESGEVLAHVENTAVVRMSYGLGCFEAEFLRPIRTEAERKRDEFTGACVGLDNSQDWSHSMAYFDALYDTIAAGKIPGVKLED